MSYLFLSSNIRGIRCVMISFRGLGLVRLCILSLGRLRTGAQTAEWSRGRNTQREIVAFCPRPLSARAVPQPKPKITLHFLEIYLKRFTPEITEEKYHPENGMSESELSWRRAWLVGWNKAKINYIKSVQINIKQSKITVKISEKN